MTKTNDIYDLLYHRGAMTVKDILATGFNRRTVYACLKKLEEDGRIVRTPSLKDARQHYYSIVPVTSYTTSWVNQ